MVWLRTIPESEADGELTEVYHGIAGRAGDGAILDVVQITAYFKFVNRLANGLGVQLEDGG